MKIIEFVRNWTLPISMGIGVASYFCLSSAESIRPYHPFISGMVDALQPILIFSMLFISFCKIKPSELRFVPWQWKLLCIQGGLFLAMGSVLALMPEAEWRILQEAAMLCFICPTATAAIVVTGKLGGNTGSLTMFTIMGNLSTALLVPLMIPVIRPQGDAHFIDNFLQIAGRVFPLLFCPFILAMLMQRICPKLVERIARIKDVAFYLWAVALAIAMAITTKSLMHSPYPVYYEISIAGISLLACAAQFAIGRTLGKKYNEPLSAGQAAGQKNTIFAIWMSYTFLTPVTSLAGGFYSVWHNIYNSYQLYQKRKNSR